MQESERRSRFEEMVVPQIPFLLRVARSMSSGDAQAEDLAQETLLKAFRAIDRFDGRHPRAWLARIARNTAINRDQRAREFPAGEDLPDLPGGQALGVDDPSSIVVDAEMDGILRDALAALPAEFRAVVQLVDVEEMRYQEAADALQIPVGTVMSRLHRARARLRNAVRGTHLDREVKP